jgi:hypothetical protein
VRGSFSGRRSFSNRTFSSRGFRNRGDRFRRFRNCFGYACRGFYGYPWEYAGAFDPSWWWDSGSYDQDQQNQIDMANQMNAESLDEQRMREQDNQDFYARSTPAPQPARSPDSQTFPATVLIFRDQHQQEVQNYAIVGQTLWNFAPQHTQKIPLSELDLPATAKANDERGVDFRVPAAREGE